MRGGNDLALLDLPLGSRFGRERLVWDGDHLGNAQGGIWRINGRARNEVSGECRDEWDAIAILQYCSGHFHVEQVTYSYVHRASSKTTGPDKGCRFNPIVSSSCRKLYTERSKEEPKFGDALNVGSDGTYRLKVDGDIKATTYIFEETIGKIKCGTEDYIQIIVTDPYTGAMNGLPDKEVATWESVLGAVNDRGTENESRRYHLAMPFFGQWTGVGPKG